jgi:hypothetical protein
MIYQKLTSMHFSNWKQLWLPWRMVMKITNSIKYIRYVYIFPFLSQCHIFNLFSILPFLFFVWILHCVRVHVHSHACSLSMIEFHLVYCQWAIFLQFFQNRKYTCWSDVDQIFTSFLVRSPWFIDYRSNGGSKHHWIDFFLEAARCSISLAFLICVFFSSFLHFLGIYSNHKHMAWLYYIACFLGICTHWINIACLIYICFMLFFSSIFQMLQRFAIVGLSNFYLDVAKDRLYVGYGLYFIFIHHLMIRIHNLMM